MKRGVCNNAKDKIVNEIKRERETLELRKTLGKVMEWGSLGPILRKEPPKVKIEYLRNIVNINKNQVSVEKVG